MSSNGLYFFDRSSTRSSASNQHYSHHQKAHSMAQNQQQAQAMALRNRKIKIVNFGDTMLNTPVAGYKGHQKTPSGSGNSMLNTTAPICITSLNQGGVGSPASHSRTPSMTNDPSRNRKIHEGGPNCPATSSAYSGSKRDNSYLKGAAIGEKLQKYAASRPQTGKRGGSSQNLTTDSSNQNLRNKWIRYSSGGAASSSKLGAAGSHGNLNTTMNYNSSSYIRQPGLSNKQAAATKYFSPPQRQTHAYHQINNFVVSPQDPNQFAVKKNSVKTQKPHPATSIQQDYRALLERQRKLIKQLNTKTQPESSKDVNRTFTAGNQEQIETTNSHTRVNSYDVASRRAMGTVHSQPTQHFFTENQGAFASPTSTAAAAFQEKYMKPYKKNAHRGYRAESGNYDNMPHPPQNQQENSSPGQRRGESEKGKRQGVTRTASAATGKQGLFIRTLEEELEQRRGGNNAPIPTPEVQQVKIAYQNFIKHPARKSPRAASNKAEALSEKQAPLSSPQNKNPVINQKPATAYHHQRANTELVAPKSDKMQVPVPQEQRKDESTTSTAASQSQLTNLEDYIVGKQIGQGAYATVRIGIHKPTNKKVAIKIYQKYKLLDPQRRKSVRREIKLMEKLNHPNIIKLYEAIDTSRQVLIIMEYIGGTSLHGHLKSKPNRRLQENEARRLFKQVSSGIAYCHSKCVTHRDVKLENLLLDGNSHSLKIIDFGFSTCIPNDRKIKIFCGTPSYMAPEIVSKIEYAGPPADIWALGVLLYAMLCGCFPFRGANDKELYRKICRGVFHLPEHVPGGAKALLARIFNVDPGKRPSAAQILSDPWMLGQSHGIIERPIDSSEKIHHHVRSYSSKPNLTSNKKTEQKHPHDFYTKGGDKGQEMKAPPPSSNPSNCEGNSMGGATPKGRADSADPQKLRNSDPNNYRMIFSNTLGGVQNIKNSGNTINNNFNIINNITQINCPGAGNMPSSPHDPPSQDSSSYDLEIITSLVKLGYNIDEVKVQLQKEGSHIQMLYAKMLNDKKALMNPIAPSYVPSFISSLSPTSTATYASSFKNATMSNNWMSPQASGGSGVLLSQESPKAEEMHLSNQQINLSGAVPFKTSNHPNTKDKENNGEAVEKGHGRNKTMFVETFMQL